MNTIETITEQLTGAAMVDFMTQQVFAENEDFRKVQSRYQSAIQKLHADFGGHIIPRTDEVIDAVNQKAASILLFSGFLGLKMNLEHFHNPIRPNCTWPTVDYSDYLQTNTVRRLPGYQNAEAVLSRCQDALSSQHEDIFEAIVEYLSFFDTAGAKLAHYYGYQLGNALFSWIVPGYHPDSMLTLRYSAMLEDYFGIFPVSINLQETTA